MGTPEDLRLDTNAERGADDAIRALVLGVPAILYRALDDDEGAPFFIGSQIEEALGYAVDEWLMPPDLWIEILHPDDRERVLAAWDQANADGGVFEAEYRLIAADGRNVWFRDRARRVVEDDGTAVWNGVLLEITADRLRAERRAEERVLLEGMVQLQEERISEAGALIELEAAERRSVEAELRMAEHRLADLKAQARRSWMYTWNVVDGRATGGFNDPNTHAELGAAPKDHEEDGEGYWRRFLHPSDADRIFAAIGAATASGTIFEESYRWVIPGGRTLWMLDRAVPTTWDATTRSGQFIGLMVDVSDLLERITPEA